MQKISLYIITFLVLSIIILIGILQYKNNKLIETENNLKISKQNQQAYVDKYNMVADSLLRYTIFVNSLQSNISQQQKEYNLLYSKFQLYADSLKILNALANSSIDDSIITVTFKGRQKKYTYDGNTKYDIKTTLSTYSLTISQDPFTIKSIIYYDLKDSLIKNEIYVDSAKLNNAETTIDDQIYLLIRNNKNQNYIDNTPTFYDKFLIHGSYSHLYNFNTRINDPSLYFGMKYLFSNNITLSVDKSIFTPEIYLNISYHKSLNEIIKIIF